MSEQRFHRSENGTTSRSAWLSYWLKVPSNWTRELVPVSGGANNKLLILGWGQGQSTDHAVNYPTDGAIGEFGDNEFRLELKDWPSAAGTEMEVELQARTMSDATHALTYYSFDGGLYQNFVTPTDQDRWMHIVFDLQASTDIDTADGHIRMYRKWDGDSTYVTIGVMNNKVISGGGKSGTGWGFGYFMGYANQEYPTQTEWFIDNVIFSTEDLRL